MSKRNFTHLGDGAYAHFTGNNIQIIVNDHRNKPVATIPLSGIDLLKKFKDKRVKVREALVRLNPISKGDKVTYNPGYGKYEEGIFKKFDEDNPDFAYVVYKWDPKSETSWENYTAQRTPVTKLEKGWTVESEDNT